LSRWLLRATTTTHTYRGRGYYESSAVWLFVEAILFLVLVVATPVGMILMGESAGAVAFGLIVCLLLWYGAYRVRWHSVCSEIRLSDDGWCEFEARRRVIRVHAVNVFAVDPDRNSETYDYVIRFEGGTMSVGAGFPDLDDFVDRLVMLNPLVDVTRFRASRRRH